MFIEQGRLDLLDGAFVVVDKIWVDTHIPVGGLVCMMLEPDARFSHAAVALAARDGCLLVWIGESGVRHFSAGQPGGARTDRLLHQARLALDPGTRLKVVRKMYGMRFSKPAPQRRSVKQMPGIDGARVKRLYAVLARRHGVKWKGQRYDPGARLAADLPNRSNTHEKYLVGFFDPQKTSVSTSYEKSIPRPREDVPNMDSDQLEQMMRSPATRG